MEDRNWCVYIHTNKINGKRYIGITGRNPSSRWGKDGNQYRNQKYFYNAIKKYGWDNFKHEVVLEHMTSVEAKEKEVEYISEYNTHNPKYGYNGTLGGDGCTGYRYTKEEIERLKKRLKKYHPQSKEVICNGVVYKNIKECAQYYNVPERAMRRWLSQQRNMPINFIELGLGYNGSKISYNRQRHLVRKVQCEGMIFDTIQACAEKYNINASTMRTWLNGERGMPKEFLDRDLRYLNDKREIKKKKVSSLSKYVVCDDITYDSIQECAATYNVNPKTMSMWLNGIYGMPSEFIEKGLSFRDIDIKIIGRKPISNSVKIICDGIIFESISECARYYKISRAHLSKMLTGRKNISKRFVDMGLSYYNEENKTNDE